jgi:hypothetical protein
MSESSDVPVFYFKQPTSRDNDLYRLSKGLSGNPRLSYGRRATISRTPVPSDEIEQQSPYERRLFLHALGKQFVKFAQTNSLPQDVIIPGTPRYKKPLSRLLPNSSDKFNRMPFEGWSLYQSVLTNYEDRNSTFSSPGTVQTQLAVDEQGRLYTGDNRLYEEDTASTDDNQQFTQFGVNSLYLHIAKKHNIRVDF